MRKQFVETPAQRVARVLKHTEELIAMSEIEQDERMQEQEARAERLVEREVDATLNIFFGLPSEKGTLSQWGTHEIKVDQARGVLLR